jgi:replicative DNA helicase
MSDDFLSKVPPYDPEAEASALGAILLDNDAIIPVLEETDPRDFYLQAHQQILGAMIRLWGDHQPIDAITLGAELRAHDQRSALENGRLAELANIVPTARNAAHYAKTVHDLAMVRDFGAASYQIAIDSLESRNAREFLPAAQRRLDVVQSRLLGPRDPSLAETLSAVLTEMREGRRPERISTGLKSLDAGLDGGLGRGELVVLAGLTGRGKSALALNIGAAAAKKGMGVLYISLEMAQAPLAERALCAEAHVDLTARLHDGGLQPSQLEQLEQAGQRLARQKMEIRFKPGLTLNALRAMAQKYHRDWGNNFALVIVDYLGLMQCGRREERREREIAAITSALKILAGELNVAVLALSQFNRGPERREDRTPRLHDLRDSGAVEQDSDIVLLLHEKKQNDSDPRNVEIIVAKNRRGPCWVGVPVIFVARQTRFEDLSPQ